MLNDVLKEEEFDCKYKDSLKKMSRALNNHSIIKRKQKHHIMRPFRQAGLSLAQVNSLEFQCSNKLWKTCLDSTDILQGGRNPLSEDLVEEINKHFESLSELGSYKTTVERTYSIRNSRQLYKKRTISVRYVPVKYRKTTFQYAYSSYKLQCNNNDIFEYQRRMKIPFSTFFIKIRKSFKKPHSKTDLCDYCEWSIKIVKEIKNFLETHNLDFDEEFNSQICLIFSKPDQFLTQVQISLDY
jgi:hypothetical protein